MDAAVHEAALSEVVLEVVLGELAGSHGDLPVDERPDIPDYLLEFPVKVVHRLKGV